MATAISTWRTEVGYYVPGVSSTECDAAVLRACIDFCDYTKIWNIRLPPADIMVIEAADDITFTAAAPALINSTTTDFTDYFVAGDTIVTNHVSAEAGEKDNTGPYVIAAAGVAAATITLATGEVVVTDTDVSSIYISKALYTISSSAGDVVEVQHVKFDGKELIPKGEAWLDANIDDWQTAMASAPDYYTLDRERKMRLVPVPSDQIDNALEVWVAMKPDRAATTVEDFLSDDWFEAITDGAIARLLSQTSKPWRDFEAAGFYWGRYESYRNDARSRAIYGYTKASENMEA